MIMNASSMPRTEAQLLKDLRTTDDPTELLDKLFDSIGYKDDMKLRRFLRNLSDLGYINIPMWADNKPYFVELLDPDISPRQHPSTININDNHSIVIGDGARVSRSSIRVNQEAKSIQNKTGQQSFFEKHPAICSLVISFIVGFMLLFSFWKDIVNTIEGLL